MALTAPNQAYTELWHAVTGGGAKKSAKLPPAQALELLKKRFTTPSPRRQCTATATPFLVLFGACFSRAKTKRKKCASALCDPTRAV